MAVRSEIPHPAGVTNPATGRPLPAVNMLTAGRLHNLMVAIACKGHAGGRGYLQWQAAAFDRIGKLTRKGADAAFTAWRDEVVQRTGIAPPML